MNQGMAPVLASLAKLSSAPQGMQDAFLAESKTWFSMWLAQPVYTAHAWARRNVPLRSTSHISSFLPLHCYIINLFMMKHVCFIEGLSAYCSVNTLHLLYKPSLLMLYKARVTICSEIYTQHTNIM